MGNKTIDLKSYPSAVRYAIFFLWGGWLIHYFIYFTFFVDKMPLRSNVMQAVVGIGICYTIAKIKKWARILCIFFNIGTMGLYTVYGIGFFGSGQLLKGLLSAITIVLFLGSTYFLLIKETSSFFNEQNKMHEEPNAAKS